MEHALQPTQQQLPFEIGDTIEFEYPVGNNLNNRRPIFRQRKLYVTAIRDTAIRPLHPLTIKARPMKRRGRYLITGICLDSGAERRFYLESMRQHRRSTWLDLAYYDATTEIVTYRFNLMFAPTAAERRCLKSLIHQVESENTLDHDFFLNLVVIPWEEKKFKIF